MTYKSASQRGRLFEALNALSDEISVVKEAAANGRVKEAGPTPGDPGGYRGATSHPTKDVDNSVQDSSEGARSAENTADVKEDQGPPAVDSTSPGASDQDEKQLNIGMQQSATGEDASVENDYKPDKEDPGTTHPANAESTGEKYSSVTYKQAQDAANAIGNTILADLANGYSGYLQEPLPEKTAQAPAPAAPSPSEPSLLKAASAAVAADAGRQAGEADEAQAGYELAALLGIEKAAAQESVQSVIAATILDGQKDAQLLGPYYLAVHDRLQKEAMGEDEEQGEDHAQPGDELSGMGGGEPVPEGPPMGAPPEDAGGLSELLGGGDAPPMGLPEGGGLGDELGDVGEEEALAELAAALDDLGISPEELAAAEGGMPPEGMSPGGMPPEGMPPGGMGGAPPMEGGAPPMEAAKLASAVKRYKRSGKYQMKEARTPRQRKLRDEMKGVVRELMGLDAAS